MKDQMMFTHLDQSLLESDSQYETYYKYLPDYIKHLKDNYTILVENNFTWKHEKSVVENSLNQLIETLYAFKFKYLFDPKESLKVDLTHSGFPNYSEIEQMDREFKATERATAHEKSIVAKREMLDYMFKYKSISSKYQQLIARYKYISMLTYDNVYKPHEPSLELTALNHEKEFVRYFVSWTTFSMTLNRPQIYMMEFEYHDKGKSIYDNDEDVTLLYDRMFSTNWKTSASLKNIASHIDLMCPKVRPKKLKRIDIGPYYSHYKKDDAIYTSVLQHIDTGTDYILCLTMEEIESMKEEKSSGISKITQIYHVPSEIEECQKAECSSIDRFVFTTHNVAQVLYEIFREQVIDTLSYPPIIVNK